MIMTTKVIRTFHPVGQGTFYTERHIDDENNKEFTIVYDCGSTTFKTRFERFIKSTFSKGQVIDILFISHFHADHINGIQFLKDHCNIKKVILPLLSEETDVLLKIANYFESNSTFDDLIDSPQDFFGNVVSITKIRQVEPNSEINLTEPIVVTEVNLPSELPSGTALQLIKNSTWCFIPFNYQHDSCKQQFEIALRSEGVTLKDLTSIDEIEKNKKIIKKAYQSVDGDLNSNSMILYSGKCKPSKDFTDCFNGLHYYRRYYQPLKDFRGLSACLYMGDVDLNEPQIVSDIQRKLILLKQCIGTIQIPHHGSTHNFNKSIMNSKELCAIFSFGKNNAYGHPSDKVIDEVVANDSFPHFVTEDKISVVVQHIAY